MFLKYFSFALFFALVYEVSIYAQDVNGTDNPNVTGRIVSDGTMYGNDFIAETQSVTPADLVANPQNYEDKTVQITGTISDVCQAMGCWMKISDGTNEVLVRTLHKFFIPKDASGRQAITEGTFKLVEIGEEHAKEMLKESVNPKMKPEDIIGPQKTYVVNSTGVKILSK